MFNNSTLSVRDYASVLLSISSKRVIWSTENTGKNVYSNDKVTITMIAAIFAAFAGCMPNGEPKSTSEKKVLNQFWKVHSDTLSTFPATIPGTIHTDLLNADLIPDPFFDHQERALRWIEEKDWTYSTSFVLDENQMNYTSAELVFEGLDTEAKIWLNDSLILQANNMFRSWRIPVRSLLRTGENQLRVTFESRVNKYAKKADSLRFVYPADSDDSKTAPFVRKAAYHFGWDWAPRFVTCGIWKPVSLEFYDAARIAEVWIEQTELTEQKAKLRAHVEVATYQDDLDFEIEVNGKQYRLSGSDSLLTTTVDFEIENPKIWWPNGSGDQHLYSIPIRLLNGEKEIEFTERKIGLRTVELVNEPDSIGTSFYFRVNGQPLFIKGANYVPQDVFLPRVQPAQYRSLLIAAKEANMNMLRVWGGGVYERDLFYELCDSLGLMVWQDFMFAGTMYPGDAAFVQNVSEEVRQQIRRLRNHPSLALWCGNNEIEVAWKNWGWQQKYGYSEADSTKMWNDYLHLFHEVIPEIVEQESPEIAYVPTSPQSNWGTAPNFNHGSMHYWGVWHGRELISAFEENVGRFMVEYGMQSYPEMATLQQFISPENLHLDSPVMQVRQKSYIGNDEIFRHIGDLGVSEPNNLSDFINASQRAQAEALQTAIYAHINSNGHCMGTLLWQLNDCWPGPSWSIIDYTGSKKTAYYEVKSSLND